MIISGEVVKTSQLPKKTLALTDSLVALMSSPLETVTVPVSDFVSFVSTQIGGSLIEGVGSLNYLPKFTGTNTLGNSLIYDNGTNVGIGTTSPTDRLHIVDSANANIFARVTANGTNASAAWVAQNDQVDNVVYRVFGSGVTGTQMGISLVRSASLMANLGGTGSFLLGTFSSTDFILGTANVERARITTSGNFLIGTTVDAGYKLDVNGNLRIGSSIFGQGTTNTYYQIASSDYHHRFFTRTDVGAALERFTIEGGAVSGKAYFQNTNVGIGTTTPSTRLDVSGGDITVDSSRGMIFRSTSGYVKYNGSQLYNVSADSYDSSGYFRVRDNTGANTRFIVLDGGNVGIGTSTPVHNLVVNGNTGISINASGATFPNIHRDSTDGGMLLRSWNGSVFSNSIKITPAGNVGIGTTSPTQKLHVKDTTNTIVNAEAGSSIYAGILQTVGSNTWRLIAQGSGASGRLDIKDESYGVTAMSFPVNSGNVGIGTTSPSAKLEVVGNTKVTATFGPELSPALTSGNWSTTGGIVVSGSIAYTTGTVATATPVTAITPIIGQWYKVTYTVTGGYSANSVFTFGGTSYSLQLGTNTVYLNATSTAAFQVAALATTNPSFTITALSIVQQTASTGTLTVDGAVTMNNTLAISSIGIGTGTVTPTAPLQVVDINSNGIRVTRNGVPSQYIAMHEGGGAVHTIEAVGEKPFRLNNNASGFGMEFYTQNTPRGQFSSGGNFLLGTTTDSGYKLDVNGTARIQGIFYASNPVASSYIADFGGTTNGMVFQNAGGVNRTQLKGFSSGIETIRLDVLGGAMFGSGTLEPSAQVTINSTTKGFLPPRMTTAEINAISTPATGLTVFNITLNTICFYNGTSWQKVTSTAM
jgi:hypothetical protein